MGSIKSLNAIDTYSLINTQVEEVLKSKTENLNLMLIKLLKNSILRRQLPVSINGVVEVMGVSVPHAKVVMVNKKSLEN